MNYENLLHVTYLSFIVPEILFSQAYSVDIIDLVLNFYIYSRRGGRAASKAAQQKISSDVADMSNLNKKKRRPSTPKAKETR